MSINGVTSNAETDIAQFSLLSSSFLGIVSVLCEELTPFGKIKKISQRISNELNKEDNDVKEQMRRDMISAANEACILTVQELKNSSNGRIMHDLQQLGGFVSIFYDENSCKYYDREIYEQKFRDLIISTEQYAELYCTEENVRKIVSTFDKNFRICISSNEKLCHYYMLNEWDDIGKKVKSIIFILENQEKKIEEINTTTKNINSKLKKAASLLNQLFIEIILIIIVCAIQITVFFVFNKDCNNALLTFLPLSIGFAELLTWFLNKQFNIMKRLSFGEKAKGILFLFILPILIAVSIIWIVYNVANLRTDDIFLFLLTLILSYFVGIIVKLYLNIQNKNFL